MAAPARGAPRGAPARAGAPAGGDPPRRRVVLGQPRPRRAARDRGADRGRRHRRRLRPRDDARGADGRLQEVARHGEPEVFGRALHAAEAAVIDAGEVAEIQIGGASALAAPLGASEEGDQVVGIVSVARGDRAFTHGERELFAYLDQPGVGVGRERRPARDRAAPGRHRRADRPVQPPPLPGGHGRRGRARAPLRPRDGPDHARHRRLQAGQRHATATCRATSCCARSRACSASPRARSTSPPATAARRWPSRCRRPTSRARSSSPSACARRSRRWSSRCLSGDGALKVTASFGVASLAAADHADKDALVAAADAALYQAKRSGKNRTERATGAGRRRRGVHGVASGE